MKDSILANLKNIAWLESLYHSDPSAFKKEFDAVFAEHPSSQVLNIWHERLHFTPQKTEITESKNDNLYWAMLIAVVAGVFAKLPAFFSGIDPSEYYQRNAPFFVFASIAVYFLCTKSTALKDKILPVLLLVGAGIYINYLPVEHTSDTTVLALLHMPFFLWSVAWLTYIAPEFRSFTKRLEYLKFNGEMLIYTGLLMISWGILTGVTMGLFSVAGIDISRWYGEWVVVFWVVACPLVATYMSQIRETYNQRIAPLIARIFSPLLLGTLIIYLVTILVAGKNPFLDREFLVSFNVMLVAVLALGIFVITEQSDDHKTKFLSFTGIVTSTLLGLALVIDGVALAAMIFRLISYGFTPNRVAVLGMNMLVFVHIAGILYHYTKHLIHQSPLTNTMQWISRYFPVYTLWTAFIVFVYPVLNSFH